MSQIQANKFTHFHGTFKKNKNEITEENYFVEPCFGPCHTQLLINVGSTGFNYSIDTKWKLQQTYKLCQYLLFLVAIFQRMLATQRHILALFRHKW